MRQTFGGLGDLAFKGLDVGRKPRDIGILWSIRIQVADSDADAEEKERRYLESIPPEAGLVEMSAQYGVDFSTAKPGMRLADFADQPAGQLNSAHQKMLDLARALATGPRLLLVDELAAGLNPAELERVAVKLKELARSGIALLVVEHLMGFIDQITDRIIVMNAGKEIFEGRLAEAFRNAQVVEVFLGDEHAA